MGHGAARGVFVTGTDTGVGKTVVACALIRALRGRGIDVAAFKPIETGVLEAGPLDALALREAAGHDYDDRAVCPLQFALAAAPNVAAAAEGRVVDLDVVDDAFAKLAARHSAVVVEGAGGLLVPTGEGATMADLARRLELPIVVVARASLGTINHTQLTLAEAARLGLDLVGVVVSHSAGALTDADGANFAHLRDTLGDLLLGEIPHLGAGETPPADCLKLDRLLARLR